MLQDPVILADRRLARAVLVPEAAGIKESPHGAVALILVDLARQEHPYPKPGEHPRARRLMVPSPAAAKNA